VIERALEEFHVPHGIRQSENARTETGPTYAQPKVLGMMRVDVTNLSERTLTDCLYRLGYGIEFNGRSTSEPFGHLALATV
jgi:hypothetical protein